MPHPNDPPDATLLYEIGQACVRVRIIETSYGFCEVEPVRYGFSKIKGEVGTSSRFDIFQVDELIHCLEKAKTFLMQKSGSEGASFTAQ